MIELIATLHTNPRGLIRSHVAGEEGQDMIEYALLAGLISVFCVAAIVLLSPQIFSFYNVIAHTMKTVFP